MIDLETLGVGPLAAILTIGWCRFDLSPSPDSDRTIEKHKIHVNVESCLKAGMRMRDSTFRWWLRQEKRAQEALNSSPPLPLPMALEAFSKVFSGDEIVWGNGSNFDISILEVAYELCNMEIPWEFYNVGCYRTLKNIATEVPRIKPDIPHCAMSDAEAQAKHLQDIVKNRGF